MVERASPAPEHRLEILGGLGGVPVLEQSPQPSGVGCGHGYPGYGGVAEPGLRVSGVGQAPPASAAEYVHSRSRHVRLVGEPEATPAGEVGPSVAPGSDPAGP